jgi:hypothetical protein
MFSSFINFTATKHFSGETQGMKALCPYSDSQLCAKGASASDGITYMLYCSPLIIHSLLLLSPLLLLLKNTTIYFSGSHPS